MGGWNDVVVSGDRARSSAVQADRLMRVLQVVFVVLVLASAVELIDEGRVVGEESVLSSTVDLAAQSRGGQLFAERVEQVQGVLDGIGELSDSFAVVADALE